MKSWGYSSQTTQEFLASFDKDNTGRVSEAEFLKLALDILKLKISRVRVYGQSYKCVARLDEENASQGSPKLVSDFKAVDLGAGEAETETLESTAPVTARLTARVGTGGPSSECVKLSSYSHKALVDYTNSLVTMNRELSATARALAKLVNTALKQRDVQSELDN
jgi:hypothetical protein